jgi:hypothetical protein
VYKYIGKKNKEESKVENFFVTSSTYSVIEYKKNGYRLVKYVGEYDSRKEADDDLFDILSNAKTEEEVELEKWRKRRYR